MAGVVPAPAQVRGREWVCAAWFSSTYTSRTNPIRRASNRGGTPPSQAPNTPPPQLDLVLPRPDGGGRCLGDRLSRGRWVGGGYWPYIADQLPRGQRVRCDLPAPVDDHRPVADRVTAVEGGGPTSLKRWITSRTDHAGLRRPRDRWRSRAGPLAPGGPTPVASSPAGSAPNSHCPNSVCRGFCFSWPFSLRARACSVTAPQRSERTSPTANRHDLPNSTNRAITALAPRAHPRDVRGARVRDRTRSRQLTARFRPYHINKAPRATTRLRGYFVLLSCSSRSANTCSPTDTHTPE